MAYNIGQLAYMHAKAYDLKRVFFGGFFIRGHPYTMETISFAIKFWSQVGGSIPATCIVFTLLVWVCVLVLLLLLLITKPTPTP